MAGADAVGEFGESAVFPSGQEPGMWPALPAIEKAGRSRPRGLSGDEVEFVAVGVCERHPVAAVVGEGG
jgi:hypothetical protein